MTIPSPSRGIIPEDQAAPADPNTRISSLEEVIKRISESMEAMKKTNEDLASRLPLQKQPGHEEKRKSVGKEESSVHGDHRTHCEKNSSNKRSHKTKTSTEQSSEEASSYQPSRRSKSYRSRADKTSDKKSQVEQDIKDFQEKYKEMVLFMENGEGQSTAEHLMAKTTLPFTNRVLNFPLPNKFKDPRVDKYDGSGDPSDHIEGFRAHLALYGTPDEIACRAFPLTLKGVAKDWFNNLKPQSIDSFDTLGRQFMNQFLAVRRRKKNPAYLLSLIQENEEPLKKLSPQVQPREAYSRESRRSDDFVGSDERHQCGRSLNGRVSTETHIRHPPPVYEEGRGICQSGRNYQCLDQKEKDQARGIRG
jgi:hypothetical protein